MERQYRTAPEQYHDEAGKDGSDVEAGARTSRSNRVGEHGPDLSTRPCYRTSPRSSLSEYWTWHRSIRSQYWAALYLSTMYGVGAYPGSLLGEGLALHVVVQSLGPVLIPPYALSVPHIAFHHTLAQYRPSRTAIQYAMSVPDIA
eukprot:2899787-Rhodomonas_salina.2